MGMNDAINRTNVEMYNEYRCTRASLYKHECDGKNDERSRQGHYILAHTPEEARAEMALRYPGEEFTVKLHKVAVMQFLSLTVE